MIDLRNTWIKNKEGVLRDSYIAAINKQGLLSATGLEVNESWAEDHHDCIEVSRGRVYHPDKCNLGLQSKEITLADLKPRVKEYVKVDNCDKGGEFPVLAQQLVDGLDVYSHNLATDHKDRIISFEVLLEAYRLNNIYHKVKTEITPMQAAKDACEEFIDRSSSISIYSNFKDFACENADNKWDSEFVVFCRAIVNALDGK